MSNNKQSSSIDFYRSRIIQITADGLNKRITGEQWDLLERKAYEQAKAMHKEEITDAHGVQYDYSYSQIDPKKVTGEQYYNETFNTHENNNRI